MASNIAAHGPLDELERLCGSDALSLDALREKISSISPDDRDGDRSSLLHRACDNDGVTLEVVECLLDSFPDAARSAKSAFCPGAYPIHLACHNEDCPDTIVELLARKCPSALGHFCVVADGVDGNDECSDIAAEGLPLHYYFSRPSNRNLGTIRMLVEASPETLTMCGTDERGFSPVHSLFANPNTDGLNDIVRCLAELNPNCFRITDGEGRLPIHVACENEGMSSAAVKILLDLWPESSGERSVEWMGDELGRFPLHYLCWNRDLDDAAALEIYKLLVKISPATVQGRDGGGYLPIHLASGCQSGELCKMLINDYPESVRIASQVYNRLPIHFACEGGCVGAVEYLLELYPESLNMSDNDGFFPIHLAAAGHGNKRKAETVRFLLTNHPECASKTTVVTGDFLQEHQRRFSFYGPLYPLYALQLACIHAYDMDLNMVQTLFDGHPEAIFAHNGYGKTPLDSARGGLGNEHIVKYLETQMKYARTSQDKGIMAAKDENGWLPLHRALRDKASLGAIKLLVRGNSAALQVAGDGGMLPLHIACRHATVGVVRFLTEPFDGGLNVPDMRRNFPLHHACRGGNNEVVKYLLGRRPMAVSERNLDNMLPIHLLCEYGKKSGESEGLEYIETVWHLLKANPSPVANWQ